MFDAVDEGTIPPVVITEFILAETLNILVAKGNSAIARDTLDRLEQSTGFSIQPVPANVIDQAKNKAFQRFDGLSFLEDTLYSFYSGFDKVPSITRRTSPPK